MEDIGWERDERREAFALTMPRGDLTPLWRQDSKVIECSSRSFPLDCEAGDERAASHIALLRVEAPATQIFRPDI